MRIEQLSLYGFGKFHGRTLGLAPGLNLLYGPNEAGKSTVQRFLLAMLYGMKKRGQRREFTEDAERYRPWHGGEYRGALTFTTERDGRTYRVERQFDPRLDEARLFDALTGADLTASFGMDRRKEPLFAEKLLGLSEEAFRATAWAGQLQVNQVQQARELVARVANLQETGREDLSVRAALGWLEEQAREIGTERAPTKPYGKLLRAIDERKQELERAQRVRRQTLDWEARLTEVRAILGEMDEELAEAGRRLLWAQLREAEERLERFEAGRRRLAALRERAVALEAYGAFPIHLREPLRRLLHEERAALAQAEQQEARLATLRADLERLRPVPEERGPSAGGAGERIGLGVVAAALLLGAALWFLSPIGGGVAAAAGLLIGGILFQRSRAETGRLQAERQRVISEHQHRVSMAERELESVNSLVRQWQEEAGRCRRKAAEILGGQSQESFEEGCAKREAYERAVSEAESFAALLAHEGADTLAGEVSDLRSRVRGGAPADGRSAAQLQAELRRLEVRRADLQAEASDLAARVETAGAAVADTADLKRELQALYEERQGLEDELSAIELARSTLASVAQEMHREFAPRLNRAMGELVDTLTGGQYRTVRIDEEMTVRVLTEEGQTVNLLSLSGGTIDQFYLALRLALLDLTADQEPVPLILDDPFVQYDDDRARQALAFLTDLSRQRQVILFTCHQREVRLAGESVNLIEL